MHLYGLVLEGAHRQKTDALVVAFTFVHPCGLVPEGAHRQGRGPCGEYLLLYICMAECQKVLTDRGQRGREMKCGTSHYRLYFQNLHCIDVSVREDNEFSIFW